MSVELRPAREARELVHAHVKRFRSASYFIRADHHVEFLDRNPWISTSILERFAKRSFALLKPDCLASGKALAALEWLERHGYFISSFEVIWRPRERQFEELYKYNLTLKNEKNQVASWWINRQIYTAGPSLLLLLERNDSADVYESLGRDKGASEPRLAKSGELRSDLDGNNMALNLFHCADDPISTIRELLIFKSQTQLEALPDRGRDWQSEIGTLQAALGPAVDLDPARTMQRILLRTALQLNWPTQVLECLADDIGLRGAEFACGRLARLQAMLGKARSALSTDGPAPRAQALAPEAQLLLYPLIEEDELSMSLDRLATHGIPMTKFERIALISTCHYARRGAGA